MQVRVFCSDALSSARSHSLSLSVSFSLSLSVALSSTCLRTNSIVLPSRSVSLPSSRLCWRFYQDTIRLVTNGNTYTFNKIETYVEDVAMHDRGCSIFYSHGESATSSAHKRGRREQLSDKDRANRAKLSSFPATAASSGAAAELQTADIMRWLRR